MIDLPNPRDLLIFGVDVEKLFEDFKAYRDNFTAEVALIPCAEYYPVFATALYRVKLSDGDLSLTTVVYIAPDRFPVVMLQPIIFDSPHGHLDQCLMVGEHVNLCHPRCDSPAFFKLTRWQHFGQYIEILKEFPIS